MLNVFTSPIGSPDKATALTTVKDRPLVDYFWAFDGKHLVYLKDSGGDENFHLYAVELATKKTRDLTPFPKVRAQVIKVSPKKPREILALLNDRDPRHFDVYRIDLGTAKRTLVDKNEAGYMEYVADEDLNVRLASKELPDGGTEVFKKGKGGKFEFFMKVGMEDGLTTAPWAFDATGQNLYLLDSRERNTAAAFAMDMKSGKKTLLAEDARADVSDGLFEPRTHRLQAVSVNFDRTTWKVIDSRIAPDFEKLRQEMKGDFTIVSRSLDDKHWIVSDLVDDGPMRFYRYERAKKTATFLFAHRKKLEGLTLARMHPRVVKSRDGLDLVTYVTLPPSADLDGDGKPNSPLPTVLAVHGGPWSRDSWGYSGTAQWLASRGYAVINVNYRGSTGFGKAFLNAANGEWAAKMHDDLLDAVNWSVAEGLSAADKVAIFGGSYGGYAALVGLTFTPKVFACGVDLVGPSSLVTLLETIPPYWAPMIEMFTTRLGGDHRTEEGRKFLNERSPLTLVDRIERPLLIAQGANDPRVKQSESDQIVKALQAKKIPVSYLVFSDEGHGFYRPENRLAFNGATEAFLAKCLGGVYLPIGDDLIGSSIRVPVGAEEIDGLAAALGTLTSSVSAQ